MYYGERFNSITHLVGAVLALMGFGALLAVSVIEKDLWVVVSFTVFGFTLVLLYTMSVLYHSLRSTHLKRIFQKLDHVSIYLLIAGTYTPYMLVSLREAKGPLLLAGVWGLAIIGIALDVLMPRRIELVQITIYLVMGWVCTLMYSTMLKLVPFPGLVWLTVGGIAYTVGILFYVLDDINKLRHAHGIWHLFVLSGSVCHFISIILYIR